MIKKPQSSFQSTESNGALAKNKRRLAFKTKLILLLLVSLALVLTAFYAYYRSTEQKRVRFEQGKQHLQILESEYQRCSNILSRESGDFGDYEYCRQLLQKFPQFD